jgi:tetratricopeptide (TPR) repeat protein
VSGRPAGPSGARSFLARARMRGVFHRFGSALTDVDTAAGLGGDSVVLEAERAALYQALGRYDEALEIRRPAANTNPDFGTLAALAVLHGERGELDQAECRFTAAIRRYRGTSPIPLAMLELQRGKLWIENDDHGRAHAWIASAVRRLPEYVPPQRNLAELDADRGEAPAAIARLRPLALSSDNPDYATQLERRRPDGGSVDLA